MQLYNTLTRQIEPFTPQGDTVDIYVCGITPYDATHLGHGFTYLALDVLIRYLEYQGHVVRYVQNVTDVDDDILRKADEVGEDWRSLGDRWTARFIRDMIALNARPPDRFPRATEVIPQIIRVVENLLEAGLAYESGGNVYFRIDAWPRYGKLSCLTREEMLPIANERGNDPDDDNKHDPLDFVLWQAEAPGEPSWDSPWGPGRPGWHIECSTMAVEYLDLPVDIHSGGADLTFPHHESEIAQAEGATGECPFVRCWAHTAMVRYEGEKMSKSLGNLVMVAELLKEWTPDALRLYLANHHYRESWSHDASELERAAHMAERLQDAATAESASTGSAVDPAPYRAACIEAMDNDLDSPTALKHLDALAGAILEGTEHGERVSAAQETLRALGRIFGLRLDRQEPEDRVDRLWRQYLENFV